MPKTVHDSLFRCPYCPVYFWNTQELIKHRNMHTDVQFTCEICSLKFTSRDNFYAHCASHLMKRKKDPTEEFVCDVCKKQFKTKGSIRNHMLLHTGNHLFLSPYAHWGLLCIQIKNSCFIPNSCR